MGITLPFHLSSSENNEESCALNSANNYNEHSKLHPNEFFSMYEAVMKYSEKKILQ
jgi:hypothetical protein